MTWNVKYRCEYDDQDGNACKHDIEERDYGGAITALKGTGTPGKIYYLNDSDDIFDPIHVSKIDLVVWSFTNFELNDTYSVQPLQFRHRFFLNNVLLWVGYILPNSYKEPYDDVPYPVTITSSCGLDQLKTILYDDDGTYYNGRRLESQIILDLLGKIGHTVFNEYSNIYEAAMASMVSDSRMDQNKIDADVFQDKYCYEVLSEILSEYNSCITQREGEFQIYRPTELINATVYGRRFTDAVTKTNVNYSPLDYIKRIATPSGNKQMPGGVMMIQSTVKTVIINQDYGNKESWIDNWQFKGETFTQIGLMSYSVKNWNQANGCKLMTVIDAQRGETDGVILSCQNHYPSLPYYIWQTFGANSVVSTTDKLVIDFDFLIFNASTVNQTGEYVYVSINSDTASWYLYAVNDHDCAWSTSPTRFEIYANAPIGSTGWINFKRNISGLPAAGSYTIKIYALNDAYAQVYVGVRNIKFYAINEKIVISYVRRPKSGWTPLPWIEFGKTQWMPQFMPTDETICVKKYQAQNYIYGSIINKNFILGDCSDTGLDNAIEQFQGSLASFVSSNLALSSSWEIRGTSDSKQLLQLICDEIAWQYNRPKQLIQFAIRDQSASILNILSLFVDILNKQDGVNKSFVFNRAEFEIKSRMWNIDLVELIPPASIYKPPVYTGYGALYNWFAVDTGLLAPAECHIPTCSEYLDLSTALGGYEIAGGKMKESGYVHWDPPNTDATNESLFTMVGSGYRIENGSFSTIKTDGILWCTDPMDDGIDEVGLQNTDGAMDFGTFGSSNYGLAVRCVKNSTTLSIGQTGTITDIDGNVYPTICMPDGNEWMAVNLNVTHYNDGTIIPNITNNTAWANDTLGAMCYYNNDLSNA